MSENWNLPPSRPIFSSIKSYNYELAKFLSDMVTPLIPDKHSAKDSFSFVKEIQQLRVNQNILCSYNVVSLFTNIPLDETIDGLAARPRVGEPIFGS